MAIQRLRGQVIVGPHSFERFAGASGLEVVSNGTSD
jgi:hypothetical protein